MKNKIFFFILLLAFAGCQDDRSRLTPEEHPSSEATESANVLRGRIRIKLKSQPETLQATRTNTFTQTGVTSLDRLAEKLGATEIRRVFPYAGKYEGRHQKAGLHLWYDIFFDETIPVTRAVTDYSKLPEIDIAEPVHQIRPAQYTRLPEITRQLSSSLLNTALPFDDPDLTKQWHYHNDGSLNGSVAGADINLLKAWQISSGQPQVIVAVVDGGIDYNHEDLAANMWINQAELNGTPGVDDDNNGYKDDIYGYNFTVDQKGPKITPETHGTHVAGTIGAVNNNGKGGCGIAGGDGSPASGVRLMSCQTFYETEKDQSSYSAEAIVYGADNGAVICQNSWSIDATEMPEYLKEAVNYFIGNAGLDTTGQQTGPMAGGVVIFAAGNEAKDYKVYPACYEKVIAVAAMAPDFKAAYYTNYSLWVDLTAPGGAQNYGEEYGVYSTFPHNQYGFLQGTSMACPHVSGIAALVVSKFGGPGFTCDDLKNILLKSTHDIYAYNTSKYSGKLGRGYIDAGIALQIDEGIAPEPVTDLQISWKARSASLKWSVTEDEDNGTPDKYKIIWSQQALDHVDWDNLPQNINAKEVNVERLNVGEMLETEITGLQPASVYYIGIAGYDRWKNRSAVTLESGRTLHNSAPLISPATVTAFRLHTHETKTLIFQVTDPENDTYTFSYQDPNPGANAIAQENGTIAVTIKGVNSPAGQYTGRLTVTDAPGDAATVEIPYEILPNQAPVLTGQPVPDLYIDQIGTLYTIDMDRYITDPDGEPLVYTLSSSVNGLVESSYENGKFQLKALKAGKANLTIQATDAQGKSAGISFNLMARDGRQEMDLYPNPVVDDLHIRMGKEVTGEIAVKLYASGGKLVLEKILSIDPFNPATLDMRKLSGGPYTIEVNYQGKSIKKSIIKL